MLTILIIVSALSATLLICFEKWGWLEKYDLYRYSWMPNRCEFCFGFWLAMLMVVGIILTFWLLYGIEWMYLMYLIIPFCSASITRKLL